MNNCRLISNGIVFAQLDKRPHEWGVIKRFFHGRVAQGIALLEKMDAQHCFQGIRLTIRATGFGIEGLDQRQYPFQPHRLIHLFQQQRSPCELILRQLLCVTKGQLDLLSSQSPD